MNDSQSSPGLPVAEAPNPQSAEDGLKIIGALGSHDAIRRAFEDIEPAKVLDVPAGEGIFAQFLLDRGWDVHCADIDQGNFKLSTDRVPFKVANLNEQLPYEDESFDVVACVNGLHRLYNPGGAVREFHRILRPGGKLYINVNNYASIRCRLRFLLYGSMRNAVNEGTVIQTIDDPEARVRQYLLLPQIANALRGTGFEIDSICPASVMALDTYLRPVGWVLRLCARVIPPQRAKRNFVQLTSSPGGWAGQYMLITATKPPKDNCLPPMDER